jgi:acid phosphatase
MPNDGHDTNITYSSKWLRGFVSHLMSNTYFWNNTLLLLTFDETSTSNKDDKRNRVFSILLGGAVPLNLTGSTDSTVYTHYSTIASVSANWALPSLGRWDCGANIFKFVADQIGYTNWEFHNRDLYINVSLPGPLSTGHYSGYRRAWPVPVTDQMCAAGNGVLKSIVDAYGGQTPTYNYSAPFPYDAPFGLNVGTAYTRNGTTYVSGVNETGAAGA